MYLNPVFDEKEVEKEKGVIIDEINMYEDMPNRHVHDLFGELLYGDQPAGWNITGTKGNPCFRSHLYVASPTSCGLPFT
ncbi:MAG: hypothetical protein AABX14_02210 [Candidatus Aenigmatarchaeota archaeon]